MTEITGRTTNADTVRVSVRGSDIAGVEPAEDNGAQLPWILPGLVDIQVNGYGGHDVNADDLTVDVLHELVRAQWARGVTTFLPTVVTAAEEKTTHALEVINRARAIDELTRHSVAGIHLEGPYLSADDGPRGVHDLAHVRRPDLEEFGRWQAAAGDAVRLVTVAPEWTGALEFIRAVQAQGVVVAVGHTAATPDDIHAAADAGARLCTHLGNGCHAELPRHPNYIWAQLADRRLAASFVADGHHLPADTFLAMVRAKGLHDSILVSDSTALAGCPPGEYGTPVGGQVTLEPNGRLTRSGTNLLAGSAVAQADCLAWAVHGAGLDLPVAASMASANPARLLGLSQRGRLDVGCTADLTLLSPDLRSVQATMVRGTFVYRHDNPARGGR